MKKVFFYLIVSGVLLGYYSCSDDDDSLTVRNESISMGATYANDIYYSLKNGVIKEVSRTNWDVAFSVAVRSSSILINEGAGVKLKEVPTASQWSDPVDTVGYSSWDALSNSDEDWEFGAFGQNATNHPNYGWGVYSEVTHNVEGDAVFIIKLVDGNYKKIFIETKAADGNYIIKYADLNGGNEVTKTIPFSGLTSNFVYYSITDGSVVADREPDASTWDLLFTKYIDLSISYPVTGIKQNIGVSAIDEDNVTDLNSLLYIDTEFNDDMTEIGSDWKDYSMATNMWEIDSDRIYFVKDKSESVYKIVFKDFEGQATGNLSFDITSL